MRTRMNFPFGTRCLRRHRRHEVLGDQWTPKRLGAGIPRLARALVLGALLAPSAVVATGLMSGSTAALASSPPAQFGGTDVPTWYNGDSWSYSQVFNFNGSGSNVTINENVTYTVTGTGTYDGYSVYELNISGNITGGGGNVSGYSFSVSNGTVSGFEDLRISDLAMVFQKEEQSANGTVNTGFPLGNQNASAQLQYNMTPSPPWRKEVFRLHNGDTWHTHSVINVNGFLNYQSVVSGGSSFNSNYTLDANTSVSPQSISVPAGNFSTDYVDTTSTYDSTFDHRWWSPGVRNVVREHLQIPMSGGTAQITRTLTGYSLPGHPASLSELVDPNVSCAGGQVNVSGVLSYAGTPEPNQSLSATLDMSALGTGNVVTKSTTTNGNGAYSVSFQAPSASDGMQKAGVTGSWGIWVAGGNTLHAATLEVVPGACANLTYKGPTSAMTGSTIGVSGTLTSASGSPIASAPLDFTLGSVSAGATTSSSGVASTSLTLNVAPGTYLLQVEFPGNPTYAPSVVEVPFVVESPVTISYSGPSSGTYAQPVTFTASLRNTATGQAITGATLDFNLGTMSFSTLTSSSGVASVTETLSAPAGSDTLVITYAGGGGNGPAILRVPFEVLQAPTEVVLAGATSATWGEASQPVFVTLRDADNTSRLAGRVVSFVLLDAKGAAATTPVSATTNSEGIAQVNLTPTPAAGPGNYTLQASFAGSHNYLASASEVVFHVAFQYHFVDATGAGTVKVNPPTKQFLFEAPSQNPTEDSGVLVDSSMTVVALPDGEHLIDITYSSPSIILKGSFIEETGQFYSLVDTGSHIYVLERL